MEENNYKGIREQLKVSIENLYMGDLQILDAIEKGLQYKPKQMPQVGYQGVIGSFSEDAATRYFKDQDASYTRYDEFEEVFEALVRGEIDYGVLPIENSYTGEVLEVYDLIGHYNLYIVGEEIVRVTHHLAGVQGSKIEEIEEVYSHPQALGQCKQYLRQYPYIQSIPYANTAMAAQYIEQLDNKHKAAICSEKAANLYNLSILQRGINTKSNNYTRFIILSKTMQILPECDKVSIAFTTKHESGALYHILAHFAYNGLNLLKIQSRPMKDKSWHYYFFVDLEGHLEDANMLIALGKVSKESEYFSILGGYRQSKKVTY
ncbi:prephenate dehydratase [Niameybacter massiliensis]|uniref:Prephenate dehydratase n=1 Tax=Holtiella tumoricola TaxID=3018743 RepID=A0AA42DL34_9FIRM|nr:prephenate dehydratase [Holtiella tumoricola]MDA3730949.1 prephenate dehydratase [Holtiella tumoricola]